MSLIFTGVGNPNHEVIGGDGLFQAAAAMILNSNFDARTALFTAQAQMGVQQMQTATAPATEPPVQIVKDARPAPAPGATRNG